MIDISKEDFEKILNVATSSQMQVYEKVQPVIQDASDRCEDEILGTVGAAALETAEASSRLVSAAKRYICLDAFLSVLRQLDLVLTPTGFGVVANNTTAPASKERVEALGNELCLSRERSRGNLLTLLCAVDGWGTSTQSARQIRTVFYDFRLLEQMCNRKVTMDEWKEMGRVANETDVDFRHLFGNAQITDVLQKVRTNYVETSTAYAEVVQLMQEIVFLRYWHTPSEPERMRRLVELVEYNAETFTIYMNSNEYKTNHYERFKNKQDSAGYCFVG